MSTLLERALSPEQRAAADAADGGVRTKALPLCIPVGWRDAAGDSMLAYPRLHDARLYTVMNCSDAARGRSGERDFLAAVDDFGNLVRVRVSPTASVHAFFNREAREHRVSARRFTGEPATGFGAL